MTLAQMLDRIVRRAGSERRAAALFDLSQSSFNAWRRGRAFPNDEQARRLAELLAADSGYVLAIIHGERAKSPATRAAWARLAQLAGFDKTPARATTGRNTQCPTAPSSAANIILRTLGLGEQRIAL